MRTKEKLRNGKLESSVQRDLLRKLHKIGVFFKPTISGTVGFPDLFGVVDCYRDDVGRGDWLPESTKTAFAVFVEVKRKSGKTTDAQKYWICTLAGRGAIATICQGDPDDTIQFIRNELRKRGYKIAADCSITSDDGEMAEQLTMCVSGHFVSDGMSKVTEVHEEPEQMLTLSEMVIPDFKTCEIEQFNSNDVEMRNGLVYFKGTT